MINVARGVKALEDAKLAFAQEMMDKEHEHAKATTELMQEREKNFTLEASQDALCDQYNRYRQKAQAAIVKLQQEKEKQVVMPSSPSSHEENKNMVEALRQLDKATRSVQDRDVSIASYAKRLDEVKQRVNSRTCTCIVTCLYV